MHITLTRTGGIIPVTKKAETEVSLTENEMQEIRNSAEIKENKNTLMRDSTAYMLSYNNDSFEINVDFEIDVDKVPAKYKAMFDALKDNLRIVKPT